MKQSHLRSVRWISRVTYMMMIQFQFLQEGSNRILSKAKNPLCLVVTSSVVYKIYYTSICVFYIIFTSRQVQKLKNYKNPSSTSKVIDKTKLYFRMNIFSICISFEFQETRFSGESTMQCIHESCVNMNHVRM